MKPALQNRVEFRENQLLVDDDVNLSDLSDEGASLPSVLLDKSIETNKREAYTFTSYHRSFVSQGLEGSNKGPRFDKSAVSSQVSSKANQSCLPALNRQDMDDDDEIFDGVSEIEPRNIYASGQMSELSNQYPLS